MADNRTFEERHRNMSAVRNKGSGPEMALVNMVKKQHITGWRRNYRRAYGAPDLAFPTIKLAIFVDGCFWHGCGCKTIPQTNRDFWTEKIAVNVEHDRLVIQRLEGTGWAVWRIKEHELKRKQMDVILTKLEQEISARKALA
jgi:DNA mismatch endonuclease (patch repair protein)